VAGIAAIYAHYVAHSTATFDTEFGGEAAMGEKFAHLKSLGHPIVIAEGPDGQVLGYSYASFYRPRAGWRFACEDSVYVAPEAVGQGIGKAMLIDVIYQAGALGFRQMIGVITGESAASISLHEKLGFAHAGRLSAVGYKFERWLDVVYMQRTLAPAT
jgi:phosphinothricin acetyltransferase